MLRIIPIFTFLLFMAAGTQSQLNCTFQSNVDYIPAVNDIWGYSDGGSEYAIIGLQNGVNIQDVTDPANPTGLGTATGYSSNWRDIKTYLDYAYVTNEKNGGIMVIDLSNLPATITSADYSDWEPYIADFNDTLKTCHNIFIDDRGYAYLAGCNLNSGGIIYLDLFTTPGTPIYVGHGPVTYAHDVYVENDMMYTSEIYQGEFEIYDVTNIPATISLGAHTTPDNFTHNAWTGGDIVFTTDEKADGSTAAYDISDPNDITYLDNFKPLESIGTGVIPHNVHVTDNYLVISHYSDGVVIVDALDPENLIEVGNYDTYTTDAQTGFKGAWGAFPYLPSGNILVSDRQTGLYVVTPTYIRSARLEGQITELNTGFPIPNVTVEIDHPQANIGVSNFNGEYKTGIWESGTYTVNLSAQGYESTSASATLVNGVAIGLDVTMQAQGLPIDLSFFEVRKGVEQNAILNWKANAINQDFTFDIERSSDGIRFEKIAIIEEPANGIGEKEFEFIDQNTLSGKNYYRIKVVDIDRSFYFSNIESIVIGNAIGDLVAIYPNPLSSDENLTIEIPKSSNSFSLKIYDAVGSILLNTALNAGTTHLVEKEILSDGLNLVVVESAGEILKVEKVIR